MKTKDVNLDNLYDLIKGMQSKLIDIKSKISEGGTLIQKKDLILADESLLSEDWMSDEDKEAWKDL